MKPVMRHVVRLFSLSCAGIAASASASCRAIPPWPPNGWLPDYQAAEIRQRQTGLPLLLVYLDARPGHDDAMKHALASAEVKTLIKSHLCCRLYRSYEPDRRYAAQFGAERAPALVLVHPDGTFHSFTDPPTEERVRRFLAEAQPPGSSPTVNSQIPREARYAWYTSLAAATTEARRMNQPMFVVFHRWWVRDWDRLAPLLDRPEVYRRTAGMVHCQITGALGAPIEGMQQFGVRNLPALVVVQPGGEADVFEKPASYESIARFVDRAMQEGGSRPLSSAAAALP